MPQKLTRSPRQNVNAPQNNLKKIPRKSAPRNSDRYEVTTYLHTKTDCYGRVVSRWKTEKTVFIGHAHR